MTYLAAALLLCLATAFAHEQVVHAKNFRGESQTFRSLLFLSAIFKGFTSMTLVIYVGFTLSWLAAIGLFGASIVGGGVIAGVIAATAERIFGFSGQLLISISAFVVWPSCLVGAYLLLPKMT